MRQGLQPVAKNYHCRFGEIDLIMLDGDSLCFIEVKYRKNDAFGGAAYSIPLSKQQKIIHTALFFISREKAYQHYPYRFDAVFIRQSNALSCEQIEWIQCAFETSGY